MEVVSVQLGVAASHAGASFWNIQDEAAGVQERESGGGGGTNEKKDGVGGKWHGVDESRLYMEVPSGGYRPRMLAIEFAGGCGSVPLSSDGDAARRRLGMADDELMQMTSRDNVCAVWSGNTELRRDAPAERSAFLQLLDRGDIDEEGEEEEEEDEDEDEEYKQRKGADKGNNDSHNDNDHDKETEHGSEERNKELYASVAKLEGNVHFWTDYLKVELDTRNLFEFPTRADVTLDLDGFGSAREALSSLGYAGRDVFEDIGDRVRRLVEECDRMQGLQLFADDWGGHAGIAATLIADVLDEYNTRPLYVFGMRPPSTRIQALHGTPLNALNEGMAIATLYGESAIALPLHLPGASLESDTYIFNGSQPYHLGALAGALIDTATLSYRLPQGAAGAASSSGIASMDEYAQVLRATGGPLLTASCAFPAAPLPDENVADERGITRMTDLRIAETSHECLRKSLLVEMSGPPWTYNATNTKTPRMRAEFSILRGPRTESGALASHTYAADWLGHTLLRRPHCIRRFGVYTSPLHIPSSYPRVFKDVVGRRGEVYASDSPERRTGDVLSCSMMLHLTSLPSFASSIEQVSSKFARAAQGAVGRATLQSWSMGNEDVQETLEKLQEMAAAYREAGDGEIESDDDDGDDDSD